MTSLLPQAFATMPLLGHHGNIRKIFMRGFKYQSCVVKDEEFRVLIIPGHTKHPEEKKLPRRPRAPVPPPRYKSMPVDQDWTNVWPTAKPITWSTLPIPVRMGYVERTENNGIIPSAYGNAELMKIPNFFHLTPEHIRKQCAAIKKFCTKWPEQLDSNKTCSKHFPITITTCDYVFDGPSLADDRAREVTLTVKMSSLNLDYHGKDKFIRLAGKSYDKATNTVILQTDRCPTKKQNYDYLQYVLTALYKESCKTESWESEKTLEDMERYFWDINASKQNVIDTIKRIKLASQESPDIPTAAGIKKLKENPSDNDVLELKEVDTYKNAAENLMNTVNEKSVVEYKKAVKKLLNLK